MPSPEEPAQPPCSGEGQELQRHPPDWMCLLSHKSQRSVCAKESTNGHREDPASPYPHMYTLGCFAFPELVLPQALLLLERSERTQIFHTPLAWFSLLSQLVLFPLLGLIRLKITHRKITTPIRNKTNYFNFSEQLFCSACKPKRQEKHDALS